MTDIYTFLNNNTISYQRFDHEAVFTCQQAREFCPTMPGSAIRNLFLYDKKTDQYFLIVIGDEKPSIDIKKLNYLLGTSHLSFASPERLKKHLGVEPGSVTILGLIHDTEHLISVIFDTNLENKTLQCHPLVNTATLTLSFTDIKKFLSLTNHNYQFLDIPQR